MWGKDRLLVVEVSPPEWCSGVGWAALVCAHTHRVDLDRSLFCCNPSLHCAQAGLVRAGVRGISLSGAPPLKW